MTGPGLENHGDGGFQADMSGAAGWRAALALSATAQA